jgi:hypothetical protein
MNPLIPIVAFALITLVFLITRNIGIVILAAFPLLGVAGLLVGVGSGSFSVGDIFSGKTLLLLVGMAAMILLAFGKISDRPMPFVNVNEQMNIGKATEPETSNHGTVVYKWLKVDEDYTVHSAHGTFPAEWKNLQLEAHEIPTMENDTGIYGCYNPHDPALNAYKLPGSVFVKVELHGQRVLHKTGARGRFGRIKEVIEATYGIAVSDGTDLREYLKSKGAI